MSGNDKTAEAIDLDDSTLEDGVYAEVLSVVEEALRDAFSLKRDLCIHNVVTKLHKADLGTLAAGVEALGEADEWIEIESLSKLRAEVGGRFQNIKKKWVEAGFPLREHRGDKNRSFQVDENGWIELTNWISKQGFEARKATGDTDCLFELRPIQNS